MGGPRLAMMTPEQLREHRREIKQRWDQTRRLSEGKAAIGRPGRPRGVVGFMRSRDPRDRARVKTEHSITGVWRTREGRDIIEASDPAATLRALFIRDARIWRMHQRLLHGGGKDDEADRGASRQKRNA